MIREPIEIEKVLDKWLAVQKVTVWAYKVVPFHSISIPPELALIWSKEESEGSFISYL